MTLLFYVPFVFVGLIIYVRICSAFEVRIKDFRHCICKNDLIKMFNDDNCIVVFST